MTKREEEEIDRAYLLASSLLSRDVTNRYLNENGLIKHEANKL